uniref:Uncharacterized protein n=1 Tax=Arundo donax TaxID=35708 RepID=A0A0A9FMX4_ARUDO
MYLENNVEVTVHFNTAILIDLLHNKNK